MLKHTILAASIAFSLVGCSETANELAQSTALNAAVSASGEIISQDNAILGPPAVDQMWQYKIQFLAKENQHVKKGDMVLKFDGQKLQSDMMSKMSELNEAKKEAESKNLEDESQLEQLKLDLAEAEMNFDKSKRKVEISDESTSEIEKQKQQLDFQITQKELKLAQQKLEQHKDAMKVNQQINQNKIKSLENQVGSYRTGLAKLTVKAPKDGMVMYKTDHKGEKPAMGETIHMGRSLIELPSLDSMAIKAEFNEPDASRVQVGNKVTVVLDAYQEISYTGKITSLGKSFRPKSSNNPSVVFDAVITLDNIDKEKMRPGMKAHIELSNTLSEVKS